jgi:hypothetical protein
MKRWYIEFTSVGMISGPLGTITGNTVDSVRVYSGNIHANDPDDAFFRVAEAYRGVNVRKCYRVDV